MLVPNYKSNSATPNIAQENENVKKKDTFQTLLRNYEMQARQRTPQTETNYTNALQELATACTYAVLKKLCNVGGVVTEDTKNVSDTTKVIRGLRQSVARDANNIKRIQYAIDNSSTLAYNSNGELQRVITDRELYQSLDKLMEHSLDDGLDLVNTAVVTILNETTKQSDLSLDFMEAPYTVRRLKRKVYIKKEDSANGWEDTTTTPIQEVFKAIRRDIEANRSVQTASHKYTYLEDVTRDSETDTEAEVFRRLPKYSGLAYEMTDYNGRVTAITVDTETVEDVDYLIGKLNLTAKQAQILKLRLSNHGYKAIATYLGIKPESVKVTLKRMGEKWNKLKEYGII